MQPSKVLPVPAVEQATASRLLRRADQALDIAVRGVGQLDRGPVRRHNVKIINEFPLVTLRHVSLSEEAVGLRHLAAIGPAGTPLAARFVVPIAVGGLLFAAAFDATAES